MRVTRLLALLLQGLHESPESAFVAVITWNQLTHRKNLNRTMKSKLTAIVLLASLPAVLNAQTTPAPKPVICDRVCWGSRAVLAAAENASLNRAVIHHTEVASHQNTTGLDNSKSMVRGIQNYHMDNN